MGDARVKKYIPQILNADEKIREKVLKRASEIYSAEILSKVYNRIEEELKALNDKGIEGIFIIVEELMKKSGLCQT